MVGTQDIAGSVVRLVDGARLLRSSTLSPWQVIIPVGLGTGLSLIGDSGLYAVLPTHTAEAGVMLASVGILLSANRFVRLVSNSSVGWLCDRWSRRSIFVPALFLGAASTAVYALTRGFWPLLLGRLLWGISWSGIWVGGNAIIFDISDDSSRGRWVGYYQVSFFSGAASGAILGGVLTDLLGYAGAMGIAAGLTFLGALAALFFLPETKTRSMTAIRIPQAQAASAGPRQGRDGVGQVASAVALLGVNRVLIAGMLASSLGVYLHEIFGDAATIAGREVGVATLTGVGIGASTLLSMSFMPVVGGLSDRVRNRWSVASGGLLSGVAGFSLLAVGQPFALIIGLPLTYFSSSSNQSLSTALMGDLVRGARHGRMLGLLFTVGDLASAIGPPLAFAIIPAWGARGVYQLAAALFGMMFIVALRWAVAGPSRTDRAGAKRE